MQLQTALMAPRVWLGPATELSRNVVTALRRDTKLIQLATALCSATRRTPGKCAAEAEYLGLERQNLRPRDGALPACRQGNVVIQESKHTIPDFSAPEGEVVILEIVSL